MNNEKMTDEQIDRETEKYFPIAFRVYERTAEILNEELLILVSTPVPPYGQGYQLIQVLLGNLLALTYLFKSMPDLEHWPKELVDLKAACDQIIPLLFTLVRNPRLPGGARIQ